MTRTRYIENDPSSTRSEQPTVPLHFTRPRLSARRVGTAAGLTGFLVGASMLGTTGTAAATTEQEQCTGSASGAVGDTVELDPDAVQDDVVDAIDWEPQLRLLGVKNDQTRMDEAFEDGKVDPIPLADLPNQPTVELDGDDIAGAVLDTLHDVDDVQAIAEEHEEDITGNLAEACGLAVEVADYTPETAQAQQDGSSGETQQPGQQSGQQPGNESNGQQPNQPEGHGEQGQAAEIDPELDGSVEGREGLRDQAVELDDYGTGDARAQRRDYSGIPAAEAGEFSTSNPLDRFHEQEGESAQEAEQDFGMLGTGGSDGSPGAASDQQTGDAEALAGEPAGQTVQLPMLLAVVALAGTTAALFRTWLLRNV